MENAQSECMYVVVHMYGSTCGCFVCVPETMCVEGYVHVSTHMCVSKCMCACDYMCEESLRVMAAWASRSRTGLGGLTGVSVSCRRSGVLRGEGGCTPHLLQSQGAQNQPPMTPTREGKGNLP